MNKPIFFICSILIALSNINSVIAQGNSTPLTKSTTIELHEVLLSERNHNVAIPSYNRKGHLQQQVHTLTYAPTNLVFEYRCFNTGDVTQSIVITNTTNKDIIISKYFIDDRDVTATAGNPDQFPLTLKPDQEHILDLLYNRYFFPTLPWEIDFSVETSEGRIVVPTLFKGPEMQLSHDTSLAITSSNGKGEGAINVWPARSNGDRT